MTVAEAVALLQGTLLAGAKGAGGEVRGGYASDLLSDVMANSREGDLWVTLQAHLNIVAVAKLKDLAGIVVVGGRKPEEATLQKADEEVVPIVTTALPAFEVAGTLYAAGVRTGRKV